MNYIGSARDNHDVDEALKLAVKTFRPDEGVSEDLIENKRLLMSPYGSLSKKDIIIVSDRTGEIYGACFLIDRELTKGQIKLKGTFLTSICIAEPHRGKGLSRLLMDEAVHECERRNSAFAILIARRAVDHFYTKFSFWGLSQYSKIAISLSKFDTLHLDYSVCTATSKDLEAINLIYEKAHSAVYGSFIRDMEYWKFILWKVGFQKINFIAFHSIDKVIGYSIFSGNNIFELFALPNISYIDLLGKLKSQYSLDEVILHSSESHPVVSELNEFDFSITKRQCKYGGHMVRIINAEMLFDCIKEEIRERAKTLDINQSFECNHDPSITLNQGIASVNIQGLPTDFNNTCYLMGADNLSDKSDGRSLYNLQSFNIPLLDQI